MRSLSGQDAGRKDAAIQRRRLQAPLVESPADIAHQNNLAARLASLFSSEDPPYLLNGGAALNMIFLGARGRVPNDIDLRCHDLERSAAMFSERFPRVGKPSPVPLCSFVDPNGIEIDLSQNGHDLPVHPYQLMTPAGPVTVQSYGFETLFAEKLLALARKKDLKDLFDASGCVQMPCSLPKLKRRLDDIGRRDGIDPAVLADRSFSIESDGGPIRTARETRPQEMLSMVRCFVDMVLG